MNITVTPTRMLTIYRSESDPAWIKLEIMNRKRVDDEWHFGVIRMTKEEAKKLHDILCNGEL